MHSLIASRLTPDDIGLENQILLVDLVPEVAERHTLQFYDGYTPVSGPFSLAAYRDSLYALVCLVDEGTQNALDTEEKLVPVTIKVADTSQDPDTGKVRSLTLVFNRFGTGLDNSKPRGHNVLDMCMFLEKAIQDKSEEIFITSQDGDTITWEQPNFFY